MTSTSEQFVSWWRQTYEAAQLYSQLAESTDAKLVVKVIQDIANEEPVHAGESLRLLCERAPDEKVQVPANNIC